ncbi:redox-sensing transcriptional repressor Rex [candidate division KSB1 bacterium]|nr:redox-sensing transcriptional repressor Rex [candidate division KSB1 bacterium]
MNSISPKTIERLILYRRILLGINPDEKSHIYSHELAKMTGFTAAQIRRDIMAVGYSGSPVHGYNTQAMINSISDFIDAPEVQNVALIGVGHLGRAVLNYFKGRRPKLSIVASFDNDESKVNRVIQGCRVIHTNELEKSIKEMNIQVAILTIPAESAQEIADRVISAGVKGILNYAPIKLHTPPDVYVENRDMIMAVEKAAYFARQKMSEESFYELHT